ncbi:DUF5997 family protein [soil metagenome]
MSKKPQLMKPATAAKKLGVYLPATPDDFQQEGITREQFDEWAENPPEWLVELRANGPHPRPVVAAKLGVSISGLIRSEVADEPFTSAEIRSLLEAPPAWLVTERATQAAVREEQARVKNEKRAKDELRDTRGQA